MLNILFILSTIIILIFLFYVFRTTSINTRKLTVISILISLSVILSFTKVIRLPQGGSITLFSTAPILILSILYGSKIGVISGLITGIIHMFFDFIVVHPFQILLDYIFPYMFLGLVSVFLDYNNIKKYKIVFGMILVFILSVGSYSLSGMIFFSEYAPEGMNYILYSIIYNLSSSGLDLLITYIFVYLILFNRNLIDKIKNKN